MPDAALQSLAAALAIGDVGRSREALLGLRGICAGCHGPNMTRVQQVFHWGDFRRIQATDPVAGKAVPFSALKWSMQDSFVGLMTDARQQQRDRAQQHLRDFAARFDALLEDQPIDAERVDALAREIDAQSCFKCHLVHLPAAKARAANR